MLNGADALQSLAEGNNGESKGARVYRVGAEGRENESGNSSEAHRRRPGGFGQVERQFLYEAQTDSFSIGTSEDQSSAESTMGKNSRERKREEVKLVDSARGARNGWNGSADRGSEAAETEPQTSNQGFGG